MNPKYLVTPNYLIADIGKVGSSSLYREVINAYYPDAPEPKLGRENKPNDGNRGFVERTEIIDRPVIVLVRDPVERFRSAMAQSGIKQVAPFMRCLSEGNDRGKRLLHSFHFMPVVKYLEGVEDARLFRFPEDLDKATELAGLTTPLPAVNDASNNQEKVVFSEDQLEIIRKVYADDIALRESILTPGQIVIV